MSLRLRLAVCYGTLFALILPLVTLFSYALHARGQYDDLDRTLVVSAGHAAAEAATLPTGPHLVQGRGDLEIALRLYNSNGQLQERSLGTEALPSVDPRHVLEVPTGPAFDPVTAFVTSVLGSSPVATDGGAFGIVSTKEQRWRLYVLPIHRTGATHGSIEAVTPLGRLDSSIRAFPTPFTHDRPGQPCACTGRQLGDRRQCASSYRQDDPDRTNHRTFA